MFGDLAGKNALVTGSAMGIGKGIAKVLAEQGAKVVIADVDVKAAEQTVREIGKGHAIAVELDVTSNESVKKAFGKALAELGHLDILVNNAGVASTGGKLPGSGDQEADWDKTFEVNVKGTVRCCEAIIPHMKERRFGKIVNIASMAGQSARRMGGAYAVSKAAVLRYTKGLAPELGPFNINVNAVCPGAVWTRFHQEGWRIRKENDPALAGKDTYEAFLEHYKKMFPLGRPQTPEDIGKAVAFLVSEEAKNITGQSLNVDSGAIITD
jgi:NAD(P)-dependent dehydrogenase (short-subunit alcohol dehydrogenase family)